ncbi:Flagellar assembly factor FliW [Paraliobacillus sp. PM-2]|uniref:flagellar assembly protein FliW n=1 Tax=Paraliobacillus sp. PM-2 TaxID=1462524 RepID=UPI00061B8EA3|nr:flagellar assembly protein FliW [Paraliobacillus sp. PM-2]CQR46400.1 Flagellar assembly factor FliW [Paraliobacillus sp. PM-2]
MQIQTKYHNMITVKESDILHFDQGVPGFLDEKQFVLVPLADTLFFVLQSIQTEALAFIVVNPFHFTKAYDFTIDENTIETLEIKKATDVQVFVIVSLKETLEDSTANLQAPIVIHTKNNKAKQYIMNSKQFKTKEKIFLAPSTSQAKEDNHACTNTKNK